MARIPFLFCTETKPRNYCVGRQEYSSKGYNKTGSPEGFNNLESLSFLIPSVLKVNPDPLYYHRRFIGEIRIITASHPSLKSLDLSVTYSLTLKMLHNTFLCGVSAKLFYNCLLYNKLAFHRGSGQRSEICELRNIYVTKSEWPIYILL